MLWREIMQFSCVVKLDKRKKKFMECEKRYYSLIEEKRKKEIHQDIYRHFQFYFNNLNEKWIKK